MSNRQRKYFLESCNAMYIGKTTCTSKSGLLSVTWHLGEIAVVVLEMNTGFPPRFVPFSFFILYSNITRLNSKELGKNPEWYLYQGEFLESPYWSWRLVWPLRMAPSYSQNGPYPLDIYVSLPGEMTWLPSPPLTVFRLMYKLFFVCLFLFFRRGWRRGGWWRWWRWRYDSWTDPWRNTPQSGSTMAHTSVCYWLH